MAKICISFIREEQKIAELVQELIQAELEGKAEPFLASGEDIQLREDWLARLKAEVTTAEVVLLLLSPTALERSGVNFEAGAAWLAGKKLIPICYGGLQKGKLPKPYSDLPAVELRDGHAALISSLRDYLSIPDPLPPDPLEKKEPHPIPMLWRPAEEVLTELHHELDKL
jgi:TIR domain-containing protein